MKLKILIETTRIGGRYQHTVYKKGTKRTENETREISQEIVDMLKKVNEKVYEEMPNGSKNLGSMIEYELPKKWMGSVKNK